VVVETELMQSRRGREVPADPHYNPDLSLDALTALEPAFSSAYFPNPGGSASRRRRGNAKDSHPDTDRARGEPASRGFGEPIPVPP
jgi:hypothetical protein